MFHFAKQAVSIALLLWMGVFTHLANSHFGHLHEVGRIDIELCALDCADKNHHKHPIDCVWTLIQKNQNGLAEQHSPFLINNENRFASSLITDDVITFLVKQQQERSPPLS